MPLSVKDTESPEEKKESEGTLTAAFVCRGAWAIQAVVPLLTNYSNRCKAFFEARGQKGHNGLGSVLCGIFKKTFIAGMAPSAANWQIPAPYAAATVCLYWPTS